MSAVIEDFISRSLEAVEIPDLVEAFQIGIAALGFEYFSLVRVAPHMLSVFDPPETFRPIAVHYPEEWVRLYEERKLIRNDPVLRYARCTTIPYDWRSIPNRTPVENAVLRQASDAGLRHCISLPIHEPFGHLFLGSVATTRVDVDVEPAKPLVHVLTARLHARLSEIDQGSASQSGVRLTPREQACLVWAARGKSSWATSQLMGTSENTVNFHMKNAMRKLGAKTRLSAVLKSLSLGLIVP